MTTHEVHRPAASRPAVPIHFNAADQAVVFCIAPGPSLTYGDLRRIQLARAAAAHIAVITINDAYRHYPQADYRFCADGYWWTNRSDAYDAAKYAGGCYCLEYGGPECVQRLDYNSASVLSVSPAILATGGHSGYAAVNFAYLLGATTICLVGYDMQAHPTTGVHHFQGDEPGQRHLRYHLWIPRYKALYAALSARGVSLVNSTRHTAIPADDVPRRALDDVLAGV